MYFDFDDRYRDIEPVGSAINRRDGVAVSVFVHVAIFLALISVLPDFLIRAFNVPFYFGGTSLLIVVGVALDTVRQMESHLMMRNYEGFLRRRTKVRA